jgi:Tfp pilus assembly protein PilF
LDQLHDRQARSRRRRAGLDETILSILIRMTDELRGQGSYLRHAKRLRAGFSVAVGCLLLTTVFGASTPMSDDSLRLLHLREEGGTASGYVPDRACAICHPATFASYQGVGMAQSFQRPDKRALVEDFSRTEFFHEASQRHYSLTWKDDVLMFRRWQLDAEGKPVNAISQKVDYLFGSGHRARVYVYRTPDREMFELPIAWYAQQQRLAMAPGFDRPDHDGLNRRIRRECMFCHNAYPEQAAGSDALWMPQVFPDVLPEGTGCQRCHGPGARHVRTVIGNADAATIRASIVNPKRLPAKRRDEVCFQCHLLPAVAVIGPRRLNRGDYSFRPGEPLNDYMVHVDITEAEPASQRFEINHHAYRLTQSPCYRKGGITCTDCHDPHQPLASDTRVAAANSVCAKCHADHQHKHATSAASSPRTDCVNCHMPRRRSQDVVHVTMTDHRIGVPSTNDLLAPQFERESDIHDVQLADASALTVAEADLYRTLAIVRVGLGGQPGIDHLRKLLATNSLGSREAQLELASLELGHREYAKARKIIEGVLEKNPDDALALGWRGIARVGLGEVEPALEDLRAAVRLAPESAEAAFNLGRVLQGLHRYQEALATLSRAIALRPTLSTAWLVRGNTHAALDQGDAAIADFRQALAIDPRETRAYLALAPLLDAAGQHGEAQRYLQVGSKVAAAPESVRKLLDTTQTINP